MPGGKRERRTRGEESEALKHWAQTSCIQLPFFFLLLLLLSSAGGARRRVYIIFYILFYIIWMWRGVRRGGLYVNEVYRSIQAPYARKRPAQPLARGVQCGGGIEGTHVHLLLHGRPSDTGLLLDINYYAYPGAFYYLESKYHGTNNNNLTGLSFASKKKGGECNNIERYHSIIMHVFALVHFICVLWRTKHVHLLGLSHQQRSPRSALRTVAYQKGSPPSLPLHLKRGGARLHLLPHFFHADTPSEAVPIVEPSGLHGRMCSTPMGGKSLLGITLLLRNGVPLCNTLVSLL